MTMTSIKKAVLGSVIVALVATAQPVSAQSGSTQNSGVFRVQADQTVATTVWLPAGWHLVAALGDGDTDLDLFIYDENGSLLASDRDATDFCVGTFHLPRGGYVRIQIQNLGSVWNQYELIVR